jgi:hypothetical protein
MIDASRSGSTERGRRRKPALYVTLYVIFGIALVFGGSLVSFYERYAATDFGEIVAFVERNRELLGGFDYDDETEWERRGREFEHRAEGELIKHFEPPDHNERFGMILIGSWFAFAAWLWPVYRRDPTVPVSPRVQRRILYLPRLVLALPWVLGGVDVVQKLFGGPVNSALTWERGAIFIGSYFMFGALVSQINVSITLPYITRRIADDVFRGDDRFTPKQARTITLAGRVKLLILTMAMFPIFLSIMTPVIFNWWVIEEARTSGQPDVIQIARTFAPVTIMVMIGFYFFIAQIIAWISFGKAVQRPIDTLVERMQAVSRGRLRHPFQRVVRRRDRRSQGTLQRHGRGVGGAGEDS